MTNRCAIFCDLPAPTTEAPEDVHGRWCVSPPSGREVTATAENGCVNVTVDCVRAWNQPGKPASVRLTLDHDSPTPRGDAVFGGGDARTIAAQLIHAADVADELAAFDAEPALRRR
jgi:hypothetical protein